MIQYVTGSRADFGLMRRCLQTLASAPAFDLSVVLTGQATVGRYGDVAAEIRDAGLRIVRTIPVSLSGSDGREMALAMSVELRELTELWDCLRPDLVLVLGDRGEMLAATLAAYHLEVPIAHIHGGERSGTLDDGFRHAISKLASYHFVATEDARERLVRMGEEPDRIWIIGAPGLVEIAELKAPGRQWLFEEFGLNPGRLSAVVVFHPVVEERETAYAQTRELLTALAERDVHAVILRPNSDAGGSEIDRCLDEVGRDRDFVIMDHLTRPAFLRAMASADLLIGNSSAGIIESASVGTPCVNIGSRQAGRQRNDNTIDCPEITSPAIGRAIEKASALRGPFENLYGDMGTAHRMLALIETLPRGQRAPKKRNMY